MKLCMYTNTYEHAYTSLCICIRVVLSLYFSERVSFECIVIKIKEWYQHIHAHTERNIQTHTVTYEYI